MAATNYGEIFRQTREQNGMSLSEVSNKLRVRQDILEALEECDFSNIPPQGYSRNMVKSYSRLLGLDSRKMTSAFLDAEYSYRLEKKRVKDEGIISENRRRFSQSESGQKLTPRQRINFQRAQNSQNKPQNNEQRTSQFKRINESKPNRYVSSATIAPNKSENGSSASNTSRFGRALRASRLDVSTTFTSSDEVERARDRIKKRRQGINVDNTSGFDNSATSKMNRRRRRTVSSSIDQESKSEYTNDDEQLKKTKKFGKLLRGSKNSEGNKREKVTFQSMHVYGSNNANIGPAKSPVNFAVIGIGVAVLIVVLILVLFFTGRQSSNSKNDYNNTPIAGLNDIEKVTNEANTEKQATENAQKTVPTQVEFKYKVTDGKETYMEIYENGSNQPTLARKVTSGQTDTFIVTKSLKVVVVDPSAVTLTVDNATVTPTDNNKTGVYTYVLNFDTWLKEWKVKNNVV